MIKEFFVGFKEGFKSFGHGLNSIVNFILLFTLYFSVLGLTSIFAKAFKKHFLDLKDKEKKTYWINFQSTKTKFEDFYRQF